MSKVHAGPTNNAVGVGNSYGYITSIIDPLHVD